MDKYTFRYIMSTALVCLLLISSSVLYNLSNANNYELIPLFDDPKNILYYSSKDKNNKYKYIYDKNESPLYLILDSNNKLLDSKPISFLLIMDDINNNGKNLLTNLALRTSKITMKPAIFDLQLALNKQNGIYYEKINKYNTEILLELPLRTIPTSIISPSKPTPDFQLAELVEVLP